jgi:hypothetical protein
MRKNKQKFALPPFEGWRVNNVPKCARPQNDYSTISLGKTQRTFVLQKYGYKSYAVYLQSELWMSIRSRILKNAFCACGCGKIANQVHHKAYTEANLLGKTNRGLVAVNHDCHYGIEFTEKRKCSLGEANQKLKELQFDNVAHMEPPTAEEIRIFLSGKHTKMLECRKLVVIRYLKDKK